MLTRYRCAQPLCVYARVYETERPCTHVKLTVVHVRVWCLIGTASVSSSSSLRSLLFSFTLGVQCSRCTVLSSRVPPCFRTAFVSVSDCVCRFRVRKPQSKRQRSDSEQPGIGSGSASLDGQRSSSGVTTGNARSQDEGHPPANLQTGGKVWTQFLFSLLCEYSVILIL